MRSSWILVGVAAIIGWQSATSLAVSDKEVQDAIKKGAAFLYTELNNQGNWERGAAGGNHAQTQMGGWTALACYGLLSAGEEWQNNPRLKRAMDWLAQVETNGTYAVGLRAHVWPKLPDSFLPRVQADATLLVNGINAKGGYRYELGTTQIDNSCTQYGALGAWECAKRDSRSVSPSYWQRLEGWLTTSQNADGGWPYTQGSNSTLNMTSAGLAMSYITQDYLYSHAYLRPGVAEKHPAQVRINRGLEFYDRTFRGRVSDGYGVVGVERVGLASGRKYFGGRDWYQTIAGRLVSTQQANGSWTGGRGTVVETGFKLVFLSRGRVPVAANKLEIKDASWDNRPHDMARFTQWLSNETERAMNWQVVGLDRDPSEWLDAPFLYVASHRSLELTDEQIAKLKQYIDYGGMLVTHADGGNVAFTTYITEMLAKMYPQYELKPIDRDDYINKINFPVRRDLKMMSLHNGARHLVIHCPRDIAETFQREREPGRARDPWHAMGNLFLYATEMQKWRPRLAKHFEKREGAGGAAISVGRAKYDGNWSAEAGTWTLQSNFMANEGKGNPQAQDVDLAAIANAGHSLVHVSGTATTQFGQQQMDAIKTYVADGGVMLFESVGGSQKNQQFITSVEQMLAKLYPGESVRPVPTTHSVLTGTGVGGYNCTRINYSVFFRKRAAPGRDPMLLCLMVNNEPRILISREDLSVGALGQPVWGIYGYNAESSRKLLANVALWAKKVHP